MLNGYKTKIAVVLLFVLGGLKAVGVLDEQTFQTLSTFAAGLGLYGLRDAVERTK